MKLKEYEIPQYGPGDGLDQEDLKQYRLKNFDLKAYELTQKQLYPDPIATPCDSYPLEQEPESPSPLAAAREAQAPNPLSVDPWSSTREQPNEPSFGHAPDPVQAEPSQLALNPYDVQFGAHFNLQTVSYNPLSPEQSWKIPRWVVTMVGLFFGSAAVLALAFCVVLLRDPKAAPTAPLAAPTAPLAVPSAAVAATSAAPAQPSVNSPMNKAPGDGQLADRAAARHSSPATVTLMHADSAPGHRIVVSRHPGVVRRQSYGPRRVVSRSTSSSVAAQETETASPRPPQDALDQLLSESSL